MLELAQNHRVFLLGEYHGGQRIPELTSVLMDTLYELGYTHHAAEIGPISASYLARHLHLEEPTTVLRNANNTYWTTVQDDYPIPFFSGPQDAQMLKVIQENGIQFWGLDQEFYNSYPLLLDEMLTLPCVDDHRPVENLKEVIAQAYQRDMEESRWDMCGFLLGHESLQALESYLDTSGCVEALRIFHAMKESLDIYSRNYRRGGYSHQKRIQLIRRQFEQVWSKMGDQDKLLVRIGGLHTARGTRLGAYDLGNLTSDPMYQSVSFSSSSRYYQSEGEVIDYWKNRSATDINFGFQQMGQYDDWVLINLAQLRDDWQNGKVELPTNHSYHILRQTIEGYDYLLVTPLDEDQEVLR
jgi:hypothetical protein